MDSPSKLVLQAVPTQQHLPLLPQRLPRLHSPRKEKGGKFRPDRPKHAYVTEHDEPPLDPIDEDDEEELIPDAPPQGEPVDDDWHDPEEPPEEPGEEDETDPTSLAHVLTVTAKKLQSMTLGRKFSGNKTIEERKRSSTCAACGLQGHWSGDPECKVSSKGKGDGKKGKF